MYTLFERITWTQAFRRHPRLPKKRGCIFLRIYAYTVWFNGGSTEVLFATRQIFLLQNYEITCCQKSQKSKRIVVFAYWAIGTIYNARNKNEQPYAF